MGLMTKGFLALMLPVLIALPYMIWQRRFGELVRYGLVAVAVAALVSVPWALAVHYREPDFWRFFFWHEHIRRFAAGEDAQHARPWWFYLPLLFASTLPWALLLPSTLLRTWRETRSENRLPRLVVPAAAGIFQREQRQTADLHHAVPAAVGPVDGLHGNELDS